MTILQNPATKQCMAYFCKKHLEQVGMPYHINFGKDMSTMKTLLQVYEFHDICALIDLYFKQQTIDKFLQQVGISVGIFKSQIPKLVPLLAQQKTKGCKGKW